MKNLQILTDKSAIALSVLCVIHCLTFPLILVLLPGVAALQLDNENFHLWMVLVVLPTSSFALIIGCKEHKNYYLVLLGLVGLSFMVMAVVLGENILGKIGEKLMTVLGALIISFGHYKNYTYFSDKK